MAAVITVGTAIIVAVVAASTGYFFRRREHLREQRLDAYRAVLAAFLDAARSAADFMSVHLQVGWPHELRETWTDEQRAAMSKAHHEAWERAANDRRAFEVAAYGVELVTSDASRADVEKLRAFLTDAAYSGTPFKRGSTYVPTTAGYAPSEVEPKAIEAATPFVRGAATDLWGRHAQA